MKKNYLEAMNEYAEAEKKPVNYPKYDPPTPGRREGEPDPDEKNSILKAGDKPGLWENIQKKKERMGKNYKPAKPGDPDRPDPKALKEAQK
jgi:hypothetical protein